MFSIISPMDLDRFDQFIKTKQAYDAMPQVKEFVIPTRHRHEVHKFLVENKLMKDVKIVPYEVEAGFNCSKALNLGVRRAQYDHVIITSPEVIPTSNVLAQFEKSLGKNIIAQVADQDEDGNLTLLVTSIYRADTPAMYFLAMFNKKDIEKINGWDEEFMKGYAYEDNDFGERWVRAGIPFEVREDITATHQYHPRSETVKGGLVVNQLHYYANTDAGVIRCDNGLIKVQ